MTYLLDARTAVNHFPGIGRYVSNLAQAMVPQLAPHERLLLLTNPSQPSRWRLPEPSPQVQHLPTAVSPFSLQQQWQLPALLRQQPHALYHSPYYLMPYTLRQPALLTIYDLIPQRFPQLVSARARLLFRLTTWLALRRAQHVIAISEATRQDVLAAYSLSPAQITAVPLAPDPRFTPQPIPAQQQLKERLGLPEQFALYFGINKPHKNLVRLVHALPDDVPLVIAGSWDERYAAALKTAVTQNSHKSIQLLGPVDSADAPTLLSAATLFLFPSLYEGFGLPVIEALACGTPVACSNQSSLPEVGGEAAAYFDPLDEVEMRSVIGRLWHNPAEREALQQRSLQQVQQFSWQKTAEKTLTLYRQISDKPK